MPKPTSVDNTRLDAGTDSPQLARLSLLDLVNKFNAVVTQMTEFVWGLLTSVNAAEARIALGAAADSSVLKTTGNQSAAGNKTFTGFTALGADAPALRCKKLTGVTSTSESGLVIMEHGLDETKIVSVSLWCRYVAPLVPEAGWVTQGHTETPEKQVNVYVVGESLLIKNHATNSLHTAGQSFTCLIWYEE